MSIAYVILMIYVPQMVSYIDFTLKADMNRSDPSCCISANIWVSYIQECPVFWGVAPHDISTNLVLS